MSDRSLLEFADYKEGSRRFDYFILGVSCALCAYVGQNLQPQQLQWFSPYMVTVAALLLLVGSVVAGFKRVESVVQLARLSGQHHDRGEKLGALLEAQPFPDGTIRNAATGDAMSPAEVAQWKHQLQVDRAGLSAMIEEERARCGRFYTARNWLLLSGFCALVVAKILTPYFAQP